MAAPLIIAGVVVGIIIAVFFSVMSILIMYYINKGAKKAALTNMPQRMFGCAKDERGTLRCVSA